MERSLRYLNTILTVLAVLLGLNLWSGGGLKIHSMAAAQDAEPKGIPDEGAQNVEIIKQLKALNKSVDQLNDLFVKGKAKVTVLAPERKD